jgi:hypothetical protein
MIGNLVDCVAWMYVVTNSLRVFFYAPQICAVFKAEDGAQAVSIATWSFWTFANLTGALYGWFVLHDGAFGAVSAANLACTAAVTLIAARKRRGLVRPARMIPARAALPAIGPCRLSPEDRPGC